MVLYEHIKDSQEQVVSMMCMYTFANVHQVNTNLIKNSQAVKKGVAPKKAKVKKDVKSKVAAKKWL